MNTRKSDPLFPLYDTLSLTSGVNPGIAFADPGASRVNEARQPISMRIHTPSHLASSPLGHSSPD
jgi:hypothetical protein